MQPSDKYNHVEIAHVENEATPVYKIIMPELTQEEKGMVERYKKIVSSKEIVELKKEPEISMRWELLKEFLKKKLPDTPNKDFLIRKIAGLAFGYDELGLFVDDDNLEEIMINGVNTPVYVFHRKFGMCKTNLTFGSPESIRKIIFNICFMNGRDSNLSILDIAAIDGCRINITADPLPSKGSTITIRKQRRKTFTIIELIKASTLSVDLAAFLWLAVDGLKLTPANMIIAGSIGSGKTTTLNAMCIFIPANERVVTIEDTLELNLDNIENKIQLEANEDYNMDSLLRDTLRMRPDRIIVGEIRGNEAITLFNAMNIGRIGMGTLHSASAHEVTTRLESSPMNVPASVIGSLDLIVVQNKFVHKGKVVRRVTEVVEVTGSIKDTILMEKIYVWDPKADDVIRSSEQGLETPIILLDKLASSTKMSKSQIILELKKRRSILGYMVRSGIEEQEQVEDFMKRFCVDRGNLEKEVPDLIQKD